MFLLDHTPQEHSRPDDRHLTFDHRIIKVTLSQNRFRPGGLLFTRIEKNLGGCRIERNLPHGVNNSNDQNRDENGRYEFPLAPTEIKNLPQIEAMLALTRVESGANLAWVKGS